MARCENWSLGGFKNTLYSFDVAKYALMYRLVARSHCEIIPDDTIAETVVSLDQRDDSHSDCFVVENIVVLKLSLLQVLLLNC